MIPTVRRRLNWSATLLDQRNGRWQELHLWNGVYICERHLDCIAAVDAANVVKPVLGLVMIAMKISVLPFDRRSRIPVLGDRGYDCEDCGTTALGLTPERRALFKSCKALTSDGRERRLEHR